MKYRKLGNTGYDVSTIGFGTWQLGGHRWYADSDDEQIELLRKANDLGVNIFDVATVYGQYKDENNYLQSRAQERLGIAFENRRDKVIYCLKLGQFDEYSHRANYEPARLVEHFTQSLRRLKTDYVDICLIHAPSLQVIHDQQAITVLQTLQAQGYIKSIGYSFEAEPEHVHAALKQQIDVIMLQYNLLDKQCAEAIELARQHGIGILVGGPFKRGYLSGKFHTINDLPTEDDYWRWNVNLNPGKVNGLLNAVNKMITEHYKTPEKLREAAIGFILKQEGAASCIVGHRSIEEVIENITSAINATQQQQTPLSGDNSTNSSEKQKSGIKELAL
ncbi:MAG: hypothetical protein CMF50_00905 [Legionellales bacterium]|nr:hypothetical protein [Legionellales bacterium]|tara:strand:+ start:20496 stop:21494 length:999 start_codon:yes stop_codon:yes gene_type:complete